MWIMTTTSDCEYFFYRVSVPTMIRLLFFPVQVHDHQDAEPALPAGGVYQGDDHQLHCHAAGPGVLPPRPAPVH